MCKIVTSLIAKEWNDNDSVKLGIGIVQQSLHILVTEAGIHHLQKSLSKLSKNERNYFNVKYNAIYQKISHLTLIYYVWQSFDHFIYFK